MTTGLILNLKLWYRQRWERMSHDSRQAVYEDVKASYNRSPNGADLLFLSRSCYGGVVRFRKTDGYMSTPCGAHEPISPDSFSHRVDVWSKRVQGTTFAQLDFADAMRSAKAGDIIYCDPPYSNSQTILYGAQAFSIERLFEEIALCKARGVYIALSIDGSKRSGALICDVQTPDGLFESQVLVNCGRSMLRRFQMSGESLEGEVVSDRLLLTY